jgi:two-component system chemotaxis response regulator CheB
LIDFNEHIVRQAGSARLIALCGSAGAFHLIIKMLENIPPTSKASWIVMLHRNNKTDSLLSGILQGRTGLPVKEAEDKEELRPGVIYLAPVGYHLLLDRGMSWSLDSSEPLWFCRPAIDILLDSMSDISPEKMCAFLLSGANQDGALGMKKLRGKGALTFIQDPLDAEYAVMPASAKKIEERHLLFNAGDIPELWKKLFL